MLSYNFENEKCGYYFDKVRINIRKSPNNLRQLLPLNDLKSETTSFFVGNAYEQARTYGLPARIEFVAPSQKCLGILDKSLSNIIVKISSLEIAEDTFYETEREASFEFEKLIKTINKKYTHTHLIYDQCNDSKKSSKRRKNRIIDEKLFSSKTIYMGSDKFKHVIYPRLSKINGRPCIHSEWRIQGAFNIKTKTGIASIADFVDFKLRDFVNQQKKQQITHDRINPTKLGRWILGKSGRKSFSEYDLRRWGIQGRLYCNVYKINTYADLVTFLVNIKEELKKKRGPKTGNEKRLLALTNYRRFSDHI